VRGVRLADGGVLAADAVVLAAGSVSGDLPAGVLPAGAVPPLFHGAGSALLTRRPQPDGATQVIRTPNRAASCGVHLDPLPVTGEHYLGRPTSSPAGSPPGPPWAPPRR
jgi:glycine/D-amino acid oxidase-like deaminating enzyme